MSSFLKSKIFLFFFLISLFSLLFFCSVYAAQGDLHASCPEQYNTDHSCYFLLHSDKGEWTVISLTWWYPTENTTDYVLYPIMIDLTQDSVDLYNDNAETIFYIFCSYPLVTGSSSVAPTFRFDTLHESRSDSDRLSGFAGITGKIDGFAPTGGQYDISLGSGISGMNVPVFTWSTDTQSEELLNNMNDNLFSLAQFMVQVLPLISGMSSDVDDLLIAVNSFSKSYIDYTENLNLILSELRKHSSDWDSALGWLHKINDYFSSFISKFDSFVGSTYTVDDILRYLDLIRVQLVTLNGNFSSFVTWFEGPFNTSLFSNFNALHEENNRICDWLEKLYNSLNVSGSEDVTSTVAPVDQSYYDNESSLMADNSSSLDDISLTFDSGAATGFWSIFNKIFSVPVFMSILIFALSVGLIKLLLDR